MNRYVRYLVIFGVTAFLGILAYIVFSGPKPENVVELDWRILGELDEETHRGPDALMRHDGGFVKIPGFIVPLEDDSRKITEFLLVPSPQACIHVPPPPPNQMVYVKMEKGTPYFFGPIWVYGTLHIKPEQHRYGEALFSLEGKMVERYK